MGLRILPRLGCLFSKVWREVVETPPDPKAHARQGDESNPGSLMGCTRQVKPRGHQWRLHNFPSGLSHWEEMYIPSLWSNCPTFGWKNGDVTSTKLHVGWICRSRREKISRWKISARVTSLSFPLSLNRMHVRFGIAGSFNSRDLYCLMSWIIHMCRLHT